MYVCMHVCMYVCIHSCIYIDHSRALLTYGIYCICMYVHTPFGSLVYVWHVLYMHVCMCVCVCMHTFMYMYVSMHIKPFKSLTSFSHFSELLENASMRRDALSRADSCVSYKCMFIIDICMFCPKSYMYVRMGPVSCMCSDTCKTWDGIKIWRDVKRD
jgi:hypothetical protein